ncbi:MAG: methyltransferase domain-containing protein [Acidobacteriota bacterium]
MTLLCTVRECRQPLVRLERRLVCQRGHSFDIARSGYCNLLQPQDRRSANPGDSAEAVAARRRFLDAGYAEPLVAAIVAMAANAAGGPLLDAGCGEGHHLAAVQAHRGGQGHGIDISTPAIDAAARRHRHSTWVIANADRFLPYEDASFALVMSITARLNAAEYGRVIRDDGALLVAIPGPDDVIELRQAVLGEGERRDRVERTVAIFSDQFTLLEHQRAEHVAMLPPDAIAGVMMSSYRGLRTRERERLTGLGAMDVTLSRDLLLFRPRRAIP